MLHPRERFVIFLYVLRLQENKKGSFFLSFTSRLCVYNGDYINEICCGKH